MEWRLGDSSGISNRGTKAKTITSCDNAFVTNILSLPLRLHYAFAQKTPVAPRPCSEAAHRTPPGKRSRNGNQPYVIVMNSFLYEYFEDLSNKISFYRNIFSFYRNNSSFSLLWATTWGSASQMRPCSEADVFCAKAKRQRQSAQSERKSTPHFAKEPSFIYYDTLISLT
ncbi:hypothetical protein ABH968_005254 [Lysinibacillus sp. RC79]